MSKVFSGHQPNFAPYLGFFYKMYRSDVFVFDDDVQFRPKNWTNKNFLKVSGEKTRITIPVKSEFGDNINQVMVDYSGNWRKKLERTVQLNYRRAEHYTEGIDLIEKYILSGEYELLSTLNIEMITSIARRFGIETELLTASTDLYTDLKKNERNVWQAVQVGADIYYSGEGGKDYNDESAYEEKGIKVVYSDYTPVRYRQADKTVFIENLSVIDYVFNCGYKLPENFG